MQDICYKAYASGRVQGVWFRAFVREQALKNDVRGWAKNLTDGRVEALLCGEETAVQSVISALKKGPPLARVDRVDTVSHPMAEVEGFSIC